MDSKARYLSLKEWERVESERGNYLRVRVERDRGSGAHWWLERVGD